MQIISDHHRLSVVDLDVEHPVHVSDRLRVGVVHQHVDMSPLCQHPFTGAADGCQIEQVHRNSQCAHTEGLDLGNRRLQAAGHRNHLLALPGSRGCPPLSFTNGASSDCYVESGARECKRALSADPPGSAGDQRNFTHRNRERPCVSNSFSRFTTSVSVINVYSGVPRPTQWNTGSSVRQRSA